MLGRIVDQRTVDAMRAMGNLPASMARDAGYAFLVGELEKRDPKVREPLAAIFWPRDIPVKTGGGWVEFSSTLNVGYATTGGGSNGIQGSESNNIPVMQADIGKDAYPVFTWMNNLAIPFVDQAKLQQIGRSLDQILDKGIRLASQKTLDESSYLGIEGKTGLVNDVNVTHQSVAEAGASSPTGKTTSTNWVDKTPDAILADINEVMTTGWSNSGYDLSGMPNQILIPPSQYSYLVGTIVSSAGNRSILDYVLENNIGHNQGVELVIQPRPFCIGAGAGGTDRMVAYVNDEDRVNFDLTVPLSRIMTQPSVEKVAYLTAYAMQFSVVKILYYEPVQYRDGI